MTGYKPRRSRKASTTEEQRRRSTHRSLKDRVRKGHVGAQEELSRFRWSWARKFHRRMGEAESLEEEDYWSTLYERWSKLAQRPGI